MLALLAMLVGCLPNYESAELSVDLDGDGYLGVDDCDETDPAVHAFAGEVCDGLDNDCDLMVDERLLSPVFDDVDGDGFGDQATARDACDLEGTTTVGGDCQDDVAAVNPDATEICDGIDNDCDGNIDDGGGVVFYVDADGDGLGDLTQPVESCDAGGNLVANAGDCDDTDAAVGEASAWYNDSDGDGFGDGAWVVECAPPLASWVDQDGDCNDGDRSVFPYAPEQCNGVDDDCDSEIDEEVIVIDWYADVDGDGYGDASNSESGCAAPSGFVSDSLDCDDGDIAVNPGVTDDSCDGLDQDCSGTADQDAPTSTWYADSDVDGYGDASVTAVQCDQPSGYIGDSTDCDDTTGGVNPGVSDDSCDGVDQDCSGTADQDAPTSTWFADADADGYGDAGVSAVQCDQPSGYISDATDCNDGESGVNPGIADDSCDGVDQDCSGTADQDAPTSTWFADSDNDGYGDGTDLVDQCDQPIGFVADKSDCNDDDGGINPSITDDSCDDVDQDCSGTADQDAPTSIWFADSDSDGYGDAGTTAVDCAQPSGYISDATDCNDGNGGVHPGASDICDDIDNDCDGHADLVTEYLGSPTQLVRDSVLDGSVYLGANGDPATFSVWILIKATVSDWGSIFHYGPNNGVRTPAIWLTPNNTAVHFRWGSTGSSNGGVDTRALGTGSWVHIAGTAVGNQMNVYIDGSLDRSVTLSGDRLGGTVPLYVADPWYAAANAEIAHLRHYCRVQSPADIAADMAADGL